MNNKLITYLPLSFIALFFILIRINNELIMPLFLLNLWALSYPHNLATFRRNYFQYKFSIIHAVGVLILFLGFNIFINFKFGLIVLFNFYIYFQLFHYTRQNFGIVKIGSSLWKPIDSFLFHFNLFLALMSLWASGFDNFLGYKIYTFQVPSLFKFSLMAGFLIVVFRELYLFNTKIKRDIKNHLFHYLILIPLTFFPDLYLEIWIYLNLLHNIQYLVICFETYKIEQESESFKKWILSIGVLMLAVYGTASLAQQALYTYLPASLLIVLAVNFSHYYFDTFLWKRKYRTI